MMQSKNRCFVKDRHMAMAVSALVAGLILLVWSADRFVEGAAATARYFSMPPLLIGMVIVGFGTSAPEMVVSALAALQGSPGIALGNAYGSNIANIALGNVLGSNLFNTLAVVGIAGVIHPFGVEPATLSRDMVVMGVLTLSLFVIGYGFRGRQGRINRLEGAVLLAVYLGYTIYLLSTVIVSHP